MSHDAQLKTQARTIRKNRIPPALVALAGLLLMLFGLITSSVFANKASNSWFNTRYERALEDVVSQYRKSHPDDNPNAHRANAILRAQASARVWDKKYDPPAAARNQGIANICGVVGLIGLLVLIAGVAVIWRSRRKLGNGSLEPEDDADDGPAQTDAAHGTEPIEGETKRGSVFLSDMPAVLRKAFSSPLYAFLIVGGIFGLLMLVINPPFRASDENVHTWRAYEISVGNIAPKIVKGKSINGMEKGVGSDVPISLIVMADRTKFAVPGPKIAYTDITSTIDIPLGASHKVYVDYAKWSAVMLSPVTYIPQALGIGIGRLFHMSPLLMFYLARLLNLVTFLLLVSFAIKITPVLKWAFFLLGVMPVTMNQAASLSPDAGLIALSFLFVAYVLFLALDRKKEAVDRKDIIILFVLAILLALAKVPYFLMAVLCLLIPRQRFKSRKEYRAVILLVLAVAFVIACAWNMAIRGANQPPNKSVKPGEQLTEVIKNPLKLPKALVRTTDVFKQMWVEDVVGALGWFESRLPGWFAFVYIFSIIAAVGLDKNDIEVRVWQKALSVGTFLLISLTILTIIYIVYTPLGSSIVTGFQARYLIPITPLVFVFFYNTSIRYEKGKWFYIYVVGLASFSAILTMYVLINRYYV